MNPSRTIFLWLLVMCATLSGCPASSGESGAGTQSLLNVSYDPTREMYAEFNTLFSQQWKEKTGAAVTIEQSHGGAGKQTRAVMEGLEADVLTLAISHDLDVIADKTDLLPADWQSRLPNNSVPYTTTIVFLVRKGNPKQIRDWSDLVKEGVEVITPNPKTSGGARLNYLAAWGYALKKSNGDEKAARSFIRQLFARVPVLDSGARGSTTTFVQRGIGDVLLTWENEAFLAIHELGPDQLEIVVPSISILAEPPVAVVEKNAAKHGTTEVAKAYLEYLFSPEGQRLAARHYYRPIHPEHTAAGDLERFPSVERFSVPEVFGSWKEVQQRHFDDGGEFDQIYQK